MGKGNAGGIGLDGWVIAPWAGAKGKGLKNKRKAKKAAAIREATRKRMQAARQAQRDEFDQGFDYDSDWR